MTEPEPSIYRFGSHTLDPRERRLLANGAPVPLKPRAFDTLIYLVERAGHLVPKEELLARLWPDTVVEESTLAKNVWLVRRALAEADGEAPCIETVPRIGYRFVAPVERLAATDADTEVDSDAGPAAALSPPPAAVTPPGEPAPARPAGRSAALAFGLAAAAFLGLLAFRAFTARPSLLPRAAGRAVAGRPALASDRAPRAAVAVLGFADLSRRSDSAWLSTALAEMMSADLAAGERLRLVPGADAMRLARALPPAPGALPRAALAAARGELAADYVVAGSYLELPGADGGVLRLDIVLQSTTSGETVGTASATGAASRLFALVDGAAAELREKLGITPPAAQAVAAAAAALPARPEAARLYAEGLAALRRDDPLGARPLLARAIALERSFPLAHLALSRALAALGYDPPAVAEAKRAEELAGRLGRAQQLEIAANLAEARKDWAAAASTYRALLAFYPDELEYALSLARTETAGGRASAALAVVAEERRRPAPVDPRLDLAEAAAQDALADWPRKLASARRAAAAARARRLGPLLAEALLEEASALGNLGEARPAEAAWREAASLFHRLGDAGGEARALIGIANLAGGRGDYDAAIAGYRQVLATFERTGNRKGAAHAWSDIANMSWMEGDVAATLAGAERELSLSREVNDRRGVVWGLAATGNALADQGEIERALAMQTEALAISRELGDRGYTAFCIGSLADTRLAAGDLTGAESGYREALALSRSLRDPGGEARHEDDLGAVLLARGRLAEADRLFAHALALRERTGDADAAAETRMSLALLRTEEGRAAEALALARRSAEAFAAMHQSGNVALALANAALAEVALREIPAAAADCERARAALKGNRQNQPNLFVLLARARVEAAGGRLAPARALAEEARARAASARAFSSVLEARLVLGELDLRDPPRAAAVAERLRALAREAAAQGYLLVAGKAEALAARAPRVLDAAPPRP